MKLSDFCVETEARLTALEKVLLEFSPQALGKFQEEAGSILDQLRHWKHNPGAFDEWDRSALSSLRKALAKVQARADQGTNLCLGWRQLCLTAGYTIQGQPQFMTTDSSASYEG
jgi:hypothetical protein